jgi:5-methylcytosine-specific restriction enzyme subunit McrC
MKTISLREYQTKTYSLSKAELDDLLTARKWVSVELTGIDDEYEILAPGSWVGTIVLRHVRVLIRPKIDLRNLMFLLGFRPDLISWRKEPFPYEQDPDLFRFIAWMFEREVRRAHASGLVRGYVAQEQALATVRGRIDISHQLTRHQSQVLPLECTFDEFTEDIQLNRLLKAASRTIQLSRMPDLDLSRLLRQQALWFLDVSDVEYQSGYLPTILFTRLNRQWEAADALARLVLSRQSLRDSTGKVIGASFLVDMNKVFEKFIEEAVAAEAAKAGWHLQQPQGQRNLSERIVLKPDLLVRRGTRDYAVGDAKYKALEIQDWPHADLYQLLAYCVGLGLTRGLLIYASELPRSVEHVRRAGIDLEVMGIDLTASPSTIRTQAEEAGHILIKHAEAALARDLAHRQLAS